jgi:Uma2 family endonuclease
MAVGIGTPEMFTEVTQNGLPSEIKAAPVCVPDDGLYELVDGEIREKNVGAQQIEIAFILAYALASFAKPLRLGRALTEMVFRLDPGRNLQRRPDAAFVSDARWPFRKRVPDVPVWDMVPDLAIEVVSPSNTADEVEDKKIEYFHAGVGQVWVVYPKQRLVYVYKSMKDISMFSGDQELEGGDLLPGFRLPLSVLFDDEPEAE